MRKEIEYDIYCDDEWCAGANDLDEAMRYAHDYTDDGVVQVFKVEKKIQLIAELDLRKAQEQ